jgi:dihydroorotase
LAYDLAIHGAVVVEPAGRRVASVYVMGERIAEVATERREATREIDAGGLVLLPGLIDGHVHFMDPAETDREDFIAGSSAAAVGGVTTVIEHTHALPLREAGEVAGKAGYLSDRSLVDFGLAAHVWPDRIDGLRALWEAGVIFFKLFTCTTHGVPGLSNAEIERAFRSIAELNAVALVHCEDESITAAAETIIRESGREDGALLAEWRSREAELVAVNAVALLARLTGARTIVAHASHAAVVDLVASHSRKEADLWIETCPQYLYLEEAEAREHGAYRKFTPPARARSEEDRHEMWRRVASGPVTHVSSDHAPSTRRHKDHGIWQAPFGLPGVETTLPLLLEGVAAGRMSLERLVELVCETPARLYRLAPRKGAIRPGADADLVLVDLSARRSLADEAIVSKAGWSPYAGIAPRGLPVMTFVRGRIVAEGGRPVGDPGWGRFLPGPGAEARTPIQS